MFITSKSFPTIYRIDAILDRLPTAKILSEEDRKYVVEAEVFGKGIEMWLKQKRRVQETRLYGDSIVRETQRVADVLENIDALVDSLDAEFEGRTGINNPNDMK